MNGPQASRISDASAGGGVWRIPCGQAGDFALISFTAKVASIGGGAILASSHFPSPNGGPAQLWVTTWDQENANFGAPRELLPARVERRGGGAAEP